MPHVTVLFDPKRVSQDIVDKLKKELQQTVADALSSNKTLSPTAPHRESITTLPEEIYVGQRAAHETDINPAPIEILVEAGRAKRRNADIVAEIIDADVRSKELIPLHLLGHGESCAWVKFCENNGFRFIGSN